MKAIILGLTLICSGIANAKNCTATCDPEVSKPCGQVCISKYKNCHKPTTTACMGEAGRSTKKTYDDPTYVDPETLPKKSNDGARLKQDLKDFYSKLAVE